MPDERYPITFISYASLDLESERDKEWLEVFSKSLQTQSRLQWGTRRFLALRETEIFRDEESLALGQRWSYRIIEVLERSLFLVPILSPGFFSSEHCWRETRYFLQREHFLRRWSHNTESLGLVFPVMLRGLLGRFDKTYQSSRLAGYHAHEVERSRPVDDVVSELVVAMYQAFERLSPEGKLNEIPSRVDKFPNNTSWDPWPYPAGKKKRIVYEPRSPNHRTVSINKPVEWYFGRNTQPNWVQEFGSDTYGVYAEIKVTANAVQRMRWIEAGSFLMGSDEDEDDREADEIPHEVRLTRGFWLADTACTQGLWQAVMGNNPSGLKGVDLPVEKVSWNDCQKFLGAMEKKLNLGQLGLCLPTEAQWEYACRAGRRTPFWFGKAILQEEVNYSSYPYSGVGSGEYRNKPVPVRALPCNGWGLYQMHGNVWEWCNDYYGPYQTTTSEAMIENPLGPQKGKARVLRGGSWISVARCARSSLRDSLKSDVALQGVGFRFVLQQVNENKK